VKPVWAQFFNLIILGKLKVLKDKLVKREDDATYQYTLNVLMFAPFNVIFELINSIILVELMTCQEASKEMLIK
jgi:hypothetical protein